MTHQEETARKLRELYEAAGSPAFSAIERQLVMRFGDTVPSDETIRLYHTEGAIKKRMDTAMLGMFAWYYGVDVSEVDEGAARVLVLLSGGAGGGDSSLRRRRLARFGTSEGTSEVGYDEDLVAA